MVTATTCLFRGRCCDLSKVLWWSGDGPCLLCKRLKYGRPNWPQASSGTVTLALAQLSMSLELLSDADRNALGDRIRPCRTMGRVSLAACLTPPTCPTISRL
ncbi:IS66 family insertion sequence element accessory protein TnpB [Pseudoduganella lutea]|uniref:Transposase n=1 Tax=Pseudoduganella lutea TaxID=321985 RepID=A0A4P6L4W0_9BURK|nr:hypothetical protein EWM63_30095 [Pseudoduganella lutea]